MQLLIEKICDGLTTSFICFKSSNVLAGFSQLKSDLSEHLCVNEKMNNNYVDRDAEKLEMMGEIKQESRLSKMERHQHMEAYKGKNVENEEKRWKEEITF